MRKVVRSYLHNLRFPRNHRLVTKAEYKSLFDESNKISQKCLLILFKKSPRTYARLGLVVGKRIANKAVARNRIKRIVRESFRYSQEHLKGIDVVVIARQQCDRLSNTDLRKGIDQLWEKLQVYYQTVSRG